jgi:FkbM family methyltransferase
MKTYVDVGTNRVTPKLIQLMEQHDKTLLIEPIPSMVDILREHFKGTEVIVIQRAISDYDGEAVLGIANRLSCSSLQKFTDEAKKPWVQNKFGIPDFRMVDETIVRVSRLDTLMTEFQIEEIHILHIDSQGEDINVVRSLGDKISKVKFIELESPSKGESPLYINQPTYEETMEHMDKAGFKEVRRSYHSIDQKEVDIFFRNSS